MQRNLPHIASMALNAPLMLEPAYARIFFCALGYQLGADRIIDTVSQTTLERNEMSDGLSLFDGPDRSGVNVRSYQVKDRIAIVPVSGTLVSRSSSLRPYSGMTGYNGIVTRLEQAVSDPGVDGILMDFDTPGGMVAGAFDCADMIARLRTDKPIWSLSNDMSCSAGQLLASACSRRLVTQTARTGSIGVVMAHSNYSGALETEGVEITLIYSGKHKTDGNPFQSLPKSVRQQLQSSIDATRQMFAEKVSLYTGLGLQSVLDTEAAVYCGGEAIDIGLADELVINTDALQVMREFLNTKSKTGVNMSLTLPAQVATTTTAGAENIQENQETTAATTTIDADSIAKAAALAENERIMGILGCDEAKGRESQAMALASTPGMTPENAVRIMSATPLSAQARSETSLDTLMAEAPGAVSAAAGVVSDVDELMNTPI
ncbi:S49 family peptidase [Erwinia endophytica]|uniref:S49 family peptidase n=1 Tax=Erwinia endophytica TaxID=1563158 RepID=UPI00186B9255|nr:S49 family peptidase [Erwinia endophytica]